MKMNYNMVINFLKSNYKNIGIGFGILFVLYWTIFILTPSVKMTEVAVYELEKLDGEIETIMEKQEVLYTQIEQYEEQLIQMDENITQINDKKNVIAGEYGEKISAAKSFDAKQLVAFLSERYSDNRIH